MPVEGRLVFDSDREGARYIYVASGSELRRLAPGMRPRWSPSRHLIVSQRDHTDQAICVMQSDGSGRRLLGSGGYPDWSPDGARIVYTFGGTAARNYDDGGIFTMAPDGTAATRLIDHAGTNGHGGGALMPAWSPDGTSIAFVVASYETPWEIHVMNADGSNPRLFVGGGLVGDPSSSWSPDGSRIAYAAFNGINVVDRNGSGGQPVISGGLALDPRWNPAGGLVPDVNTTRKY